MLENFLFSVNIHFKYIFDRSQIMVTVHGSQVINTFETK